MQTQFIRLAVLGVALLILPTVFAQMPQGSMGGMPMIGPLFLENGQFSTLLTTVNMASVIERVDIILLDPGGRQAARETLSLAPHSQTQVRLRSMLDNAGSAVTMGSLEMIVSDATMPVAAQLSISGLNSALPLHFEEELEMLSAKGSQTSRAAIVSAVGPPTLALRSLSSSPQRAVVDCLSEGGVTTESAVNVPPETLILWPACVSTAAAAHSLLNPSAGNPAGQARSIGLSVTTNSMPGELAVFGVGLRSAAAAGSIYAPINFTDPAMANSANTVFTGVPVGRTDTLSGVAFRPELGVTNFGNAPADVNVRYSVTRFGQVQSTHVAHVTVPPWDSSTIAIPGLKGDPEMRNSFIIESNASPGELYASMRSVGGSTPWVSEVLGLDQKQTHNAGLHPWNIDGTTSTLLLFNDTSLQQHFHFLISAGTTIWQKTLTLASFETRAIDINALIAGGEKDDSGQVLPQDISAGQLDWFTEEPQEGTGRLLQSRPAAFLARGFNCGNTVVACGAHNTPGSLSTAVGSTGSSTVLVTWCTGPLIDCTGTRTSQTGSYNVAWDVDNTSIASISGPVDQPTATFLGVSPGTTSATASIDSGVCFAPQTALTTKPTVSVTAGPTAILAWHAGSQKLSNCVDISAAGNPSSGGTFNWTTSSSQISLTNQTTQTVHACSVADQWSAKAGDISISVTYTVNNIQSDPKTTTISILKPTGISQVSSTRNGTGHTCTTTTETPDCAQSTYSDSGSYSYASYVRTVVSNITEQLTGAPITLNMVFTESYSVSGVITGSGPGAQISDCYYYCSSKCRQGQSDTLGPATQTIYANGLQVGTHSVTWSCTDASVQ
jgi:hypothetical protein